MKLLANENVAAPLIRTLRDAGYDISYVADFNSGITDDEVIESDKSD